MFLSYKWPYLAALPSSSLFRIFAMRSSVVKAENFTDTTSFAFPMLQSQLDILNEPETNPFESNGRSSDMEEAYPTLQLLDSDHEGDSDIEIL